MLKRDKNHS